MLRTTNTIIIYLLGIMSFRELALVRTSPLPHETSPGPGSDNGTIISDPKHGLVTWDENCGGPATIFNYNFPRCFHETKCSVSQRKTYVVKLNYIPTRSSSTLIIFVGASSNTTDVTVFNGTAEGSMVAGELNYVQYFFNLNDSFPKNEPIDIQVSLVGTEGLEACSIFRATAAGEIVIPSLTFLVLFQVFQRL